MSSLNDEKIIIIKNEISNLRKDIQALDTKRAAAEVEMMELETKTDHYINEFQGIINYCNNELETFSGFSYRLLANSFDLKSENAIRYKHLVSYVNNTFIALKFQINVDVITTGQKNIECKLDAIKAFILPFINYHHQEFERIMNVKTLIDKQKAILTDKIQIREKFLTINQ